MKKLRLTAAIYDNVAMEYVTHSTELELPDNVADMLASAISKHISSAKTFGHGDGNMKKLVFHTPLRDEKRYKIYNALYILDENGNDCGGFAKL
jgi:hypothetical protein